MHSDENASSPDNDEPNQEYFRSDSTGHEALKLRHVRRCLPQASRESSI